MTTRADRRVRSLVLRSAVSLGSLAVLFWLVDLDGVLARLGQLRPAWVVVALGISVGQVVVSAWRWRFTAGRLGIDLPYADALREYYLATFFNQVLPGGVVGDVSRAWRHARRRQHVEAPVNPAVTAVVLERVSGQVVMIAAALVSCLSLPMMLDAVSWPFVSGAVVASVGVGAMTIVWLRRLASTQTVLRDVGHDVRQALLAKDAFPLQFASSALVVGSYVIVYLVAARAVGVGTSALALLPLVAPILMTMLIPVTIAGWGVREVAAGALWSMAGLTAVDGVAISVAYGLLVLVSSLPGALVLVLCRDRLGPAPS